MADHIIHKLCFDFELSAKDRAFQLQEDTKAILYHSVLSSLDEIFNSLSPNGTTIRFNRLEIDLGSIKQHELADVLKNRLPEQLLELLRVHTETCKMDGVNSTEAELIPDQVAIFDTLIFYLKTGVMPWWVSGNSKKILSEKTISELLKDSSEEQLIRISQIIDKPGVLERLGKQCEFSGKESGPKAKTLKDKPADQDLFSLLLHEVKGVIKQEKAFTGLWKKIRTEMLKEFLKNKRLWETIPSGTSLVSILPEIREQVKVLVRIMTFSFSEAGISPTDSIRLLKKAQIVFGKDNVIECLIDEQIAQIRTQQAAENTYTEDEASSAEKPETKLEYEAENELNEALQDGIYIENAGVILLWPFLTAYFSGLKLISDNRFVSDEARTRAVLLLQYLVTGETDYQEYELILYKILCGMPVHHPVVDELQLSASEAKEAQELIQAVIDNWQGIGKVSVEGFRESFLKREGKLQTIGTDWSLKINRKTIDILLDRLPWMISTIKLKWMNKILYVEW